MHFYVQRLLKKINYKFLTRQLLHNYIYKMDKAYFRHLNGANEFQLTLFYTNETLGVNRQFNFCRQINENVGTFLSRVNTNVEKALNKKKKKKDVEKHVVSASLYLNNNKLEDDQVLCEEVFRKSNNVVLEILDNHYNIVINSPWIESIALPSSILATFPVYPVKVESYFTDTKVSEYKWYRSNNKENWEEVGNGFIYYPSNNDVNCYLKLSCIPKNDEHEGPVVETISEVKVDASPGYCPFETRQQFTQNKTNNNEFRVVSYNILADLYCDSDFTRTVLHPYCPPYALAIDYRKQLVLKELLGYNADLICLQEVDKKIFLHDFMDVFPNFDYELNFTQKGGEVAEGLACIYNKNKFSLIENDGTVIAEELQNNLIFKEFFEKISLNEKVKERLTQRKNVLQTLLLEFKENGKFLLIANTHLYFHPDADHIRLIQGGLSILYLKEKVRNIKEKFPDKDISLIFCGDFNSSPDCGIYKLYTTGKVPENIIDFKSNAEEVITNISFEQPFKLASGCGLPKYTNFTAGFQDCLDYIYYDTEELSVSNVVPMPSIEELTAHTALPSIVFPSDHISLICDLKWNN